MKKIKVKRIKARAGADAVAKKFSENNKLGSNLLGLLSYNITEPVKA